MDMETEHNITTEHHEGDLDDLIQYEEVEYDYEEVMGDDLNKIDHTMEEEHLDYEEEDSRVVPVGITKVSVPVSQPVNVEPKPTIVRNAQGQLLILKNSPATVVKLISPPVQQRIVPSGIQIVRKVGNTIISPPQQKIVTQVLSPQSENKTQFILKQGTGQQIILATPSTSKQEPTPSTTITRQIIPANRSNVTITKTNNKAPTILNTRVVPKPAPPSITVKQIRSPQGIIQQQTLLNRTPTKAPAAVTQKVLVPQQQQQQQQRLIRVPGSNNSYQAVNIPGKGVQYVRVLNSQAPTNATSTSPKATVASGSPKKLLNSSLSPSSSGSKMLVPGKTSGTYTLVQTGSPQTSVANTKHLVRATPPVHKKPVPQPQKLIAVVKKEKEDSKPKIGEKVTRTTVLTTTQLNQLKGVSIIPGSNSKTKIVMLPSDYMDQLKELQAKQPDKKLMPRTIVTTTRGIKTEEEELGGKKRRCNCTKSQCLKLYCDCFAAGEFCSNCNCKDCLNDLENEDERQKAIRACLERNPFAFKPKIKDTETLRLHHKGCNCKRSGCLKNYCECYEAKVTCSGICKCIGCHNFDPAMAEEKEAAERELQREKAALKRAAQEPVDKLGVIGPKHPYNFMTPDVIEATVQCMIAQAEECQKRHVTTKASERMILEEFGRCLVEIIDFSIKNDN